MTVEGSKDHTTTIVMKARSEKVIGTFPGITEVIKLYHIHLFIKNTNKRVEKIYRTICHCYLKVVPQTLKMDKNERKRGEEDRKEEKGEKESKVLWSRS